MADPVTIANEFVKFYYATFDQGRNNLGPVYVCDASSQEIHRIDAEYRRNQIPC